MKEGSFGNAGPGQETERGDGKICIHFLCVHYSVHCWENQQQKEDLAIKRYRKALLV